MDLLVIQSFLTLLFIIPRIFSMLKFSPITTSLDELIKKRVSWLRAHADDIESSYTKEQTMIKDNKVFINTIFIIKLLLLTAVVVLCVLNVL